MLHRDNAMPARAVRRRSADAAMARVEAFRILRPAAAQRARARRPALHGGRRLVDNPRPAARPAPRAAPRSSVVSEILTRLPEFISHHPLLSFGFIGVLVALIVTEINRFTRGYRALTPAGLTQLINRENPLLIDVSSVQDYEKGHVPGARHVPPSQLDPDGKDLAKARERPVALVCKTGQASAQAARKLVKAGFKQVYWLDGGLGAWIEAQMPVVKGRATG